MQLISPIKQHQFSAKHKRCVESKTVQPTISSFSSRAEKEKYFKRRLTQTLLEASIPLYKLNHASFRGFLEEFTNFTCPDESTIRKVHVETPLPKEKSGYNVLVTGLGPAGFALSHYLMNEGHNVTVIDGLKISPLHFDIAKPIKHGKEIKISL